jgi:lipoate---protein ligase
MESWRLLPFETAPVAQNLAAGDALLEGLAHTNQPALHWYHSDTTALVVGTGQSLDEIHRPACDQAGIALHRRSSGGAAVLITPDLLMVDVAIPTAHPLRLADVTQSYRWFGDVWVNTLYRLGLRARTIGVAEAREDTRTLDPLLRRVCFGGFSPYEVLIHHRKIVGFSQVRRRNGILLQAGLYLRWHPSELVALLALSPDAQRTLTALLTARSSGLAEERQHMRDPLEGTPDRAEEIACIQRAFAAALEERHGVMLGQEEWSAEEQAAQSAATTRYAALS